jgi:hypothetical protein
MKPGEHIHTGMRVWDREDRIWIVESVLSEVGKLGVPDFQHSVILKADVLGDLVMFTQVAWETFVKDYYHRRTGLEHSEGLELEEPIYEGPAIGYHCIKLGHDEQSVIRIPERVRRAKEVVRAEVEATRYKAGSYAEWYERAKPTGAWKLVLDPIL